MIREVVLKHYSVVERERDDKTTKVGLRCTTQKLKNAMATSVPYQPRFLKVLCTTKRALVEREKLNSYRTMFLFTFSHIKYKYLYLILNNVNHDYKRENIYARHKMKRDNKNLHLFLFCCFV